MISKILFQIIGIISVILISFGVPLAIREASRDTRLFVVYLILAIIGFIGLVIVALRIMFLKRKINTPREKK